MDVKKICTYTRREKKRVNRIESVTKKKAKKTKLVESEEEEGEGEEKNSYGKKERKRKSCFLFFFFKKTTYFYVYAFIIYLVYVKSRFILALYSESCRCLSFIRASAFPMC